MILAAATKIQMSQEAKLVLEKYKAMKKEYHERLQEAAGNDRATHDIMLLYSPPLNMLARNFVDYAITDMQGDEYLT